MINYHMSSTGEKYLLSLKEVEIVVDQDGLENHKWEHEVNRISVISTISSGI